MRYKEKIITHAEYVEGNIERLILDIQSNRLSKEELIKNLTAVKIKTEYILNLINLEN